MAIARRLTKKEYERERLSPIVDGLFQSAPGKLPGRISIWTALKDESGSMGPYRKEHGLFLPTVRDKLRAKVGPKGVKLLYASYGVVSGGFASGDYTPFEDAVEPAYVPDHQTPLGGSLKALAEKMESFIQVVRRAETSIRDNKVLILSDLMASGEAEAETREGVEFFLAIAAKYRAEITLVLPDREAFDRDLAAKLNPANRELKFLTDDPDSIVEFALESLVSAAGIPGGSKVRVPQ